MNVKSVAKIKAFGFGWRPDLPDTRDFSYSARRETLKRLPKKIDIRKNSPPVLNQGAIGSCTANAISSAHHFDQLRQKARSAFGPSRLFIYYNERALEGSTKYDAGAYLRDGFKTIAKQGVCSELVWAYDEKKFAQRPPRSCYVDALSHQAIEYMRVQQTLGQLKGCLAEGFPFVFGFSVYSSFQSKEVASNGIVSLPSNGEPVVGGHAVMAVGYSDSKQRFIVQNSWGTDWGDKGFFYMPYSYLTDPDLAADIWTLRLVET